MSKKDKRRKPKSPIMSRAQKEAKILQDLRNNIRTQKSKEGEQSEAGKHLVSSANLAGGEVVLYELKEGATSDVLAKEEREYGPFNIGGEGSVFIPQYLQEGDTLFKHPEIVPTPLMRVIINKLAVGDGNITSELSNLTSDQLGICIQESICRWHTRARKEG